MATIGRLGSHSIPIQSFRAAEAWFIKGQRLLLMPRSNNTTFETFITSSPGSNIHPYSVLLTLREYCNSKTPRFSLKYGNWASLKNGRNTHKQIIGVIWEKNQVPGTASITPCTTAFSGTVVNVNCTTHFYPMCKKNVNQFS